MLSFFDYKDIPNTRSNPLWGVERIHGELLKLGIQVAKLTIQRYIGKKSTPRGPGQSWSTFLKTHA